MNFYNFMYVTSTKILITKYETLFQGTSPLAPHEIYYKHLLFLFFERLESFHFPKNLEDRFSNDWKIGKGFWKLSNVPTWNRQMNEAKSLFLHGMILNQYHGLKKLRHVFFYFSWRYYRSVLSKWVCCI